jgi:hypothetical protein
LALSCIVYLPGVEVDGLAHGDSYINRLMTSSRSLCSKLRLTI